MASSTLSPHRLVDLDLSDSEVQQSKKCNSNKENEKVEIFDVSHIIHSPTSDCDSGVLKDKGISELDVSHFLGDSPAKVVCHKKQKKDSKTKQPPLITVVDEVLPKSKFQVNMKQTKSTSFFKPDKNVEKSTSKPKKKGRVVPSRYMQSAQNFKIQTPPNKVSKSSLNLPKTNSRSSGDSSVVSGNSNTRIKPTSTPNKQDLPLPYIDASTIIHDVSTTADIPKPTCSRDIFKNIKNNNDKPPQQDETEEPLNQIDVGILYSDYLQNLYLDKMMQNAIEKRDADATRQIHDLYNLVQSNNETELDLHLKLNKINHNNMVSHLGNIQSAVVSKINTSLPDMKAKHNNLAKNLDTVPHQIATEGIFHPNDESYIDDMTNNLMETEQLLKKIEEVTESTLPSLSLYNSHLKQLVETISTEKDEIEQTNELLAAMETSTIQQTSLKFQHLEKDTDSEPLVNS